MKKYIPILAISTAFIVSCKKDGIGTNKTFGLMETPSTTLSAVPLASPLSFGGNIPSFYMLEMPPIGNQGGEGSCVAWATTYACRSYQRDENYYNTNGTMNYSKVCSPEYVYNQIKVGSCSGGAYFVSNNGHIGALDLLKSQGACSWETMPYNDNDCSTLPNSSQQTEAQENKISDFERIVDFTTNNLKILLLNRYPIIIGARLDEKFMGADENFIWEESGGGFVGNHAMVVCGWDDNKNAFKLMNSWGENWGDNGFTWLDYNYFSDVVFEAYTTEPMNGNNPIIPTDNLIAYYPFNNNSNDETGNGNNGTPNGAVITMDRKGSPNGAYYFSNEASQINCIDNNLPEGSSDRTLCGWFYATTQQANLGFGGGTIVSYGSPSTNNHNHLAISGNTIRYGGWANDLDYSYTHPINEWVFFAVTFDGTTAKIYVNGSFVFQGNKASWETISDATSYHLGGGFENVTLDDIRVYGRVLNGTEINALYNE